MLTLLRYFLGFLLIKISGDDSELFLNDIISKGINIWNLHYKNRCIYGNISTKNFIKLFSIHHGVKCKIKIVKKYGLYFKTKNYKKRIGLFIGVATFLTVLFFLSNFVWIINVEGNNTVPTEEIIYTCKSIGIKEGIFKNRINSKYDAQKLMLSHKKISWCSFNIEGCILTINISEIEPSDEEIRNTPSNIKSKTAGKIKKIDAITGDVLVKIGDVVSENELLVSGVVQNKSGVHLVYSEAVITAETKRVFSSNGQYTQYCSTPVGESKTHISIDFFGVKIPFYLKNIKDEYELEKNANRLMLFGKKIPIKLAYEKYNILQKEKVTYSAIELEEILYNDICEQIEKFNFISIKEVSREIIKNDNGLLLKITYDCEENIAVQDKILLSKVN